MIMKKKVDKEEQKRMPYMEAFQTYLNDNVVPFDLPGHCGNLHTDVEKIIGHKIYKTDLNSPSGSIMDNPVHPTGSIKEAQILFAKACGADKCKFSVNGSTGGNLMMLLSVLNERDKIIIPRNIHKSIIGALVLSGAHPVFIMPEIDKALEVATQPRFETWKKTIDENPDAKAILVINPTYFGACCDLKRLVKYAHKKNMIVCVDEAHGTHLNFSSKTPCSAMSAGADICSVSIHKGGASLTQASVVLYNNLFINDYDVDKAYNMLTTTSPSTFLLASLDAARKFMVFKGSRYINRAVKYAEEAYERINKIPGFRIRGEDYFKHLGIKDFDRTKVVLDVSELDINGFEFYRLIRSKYHIQPELSETYCVLFLFGLGMTHEYLDKLVSALEEISKEHYFGNQAREDHHYNEGFPELKMIPRDAYNKNIKKVRLEDAIGEVSKEAIMIYPPGIPLIMPGEIFNKGIINTLLYYKKSKTEIVCENEGCDFVNVVDE